MKQLVSLLRTTAKPCITGARLNHDHEKAKAEPAVGNWHADVNAAGQNFGQRMKDGCSSHPGLPPRHGTALVCHATRSPALGMDTSALPVPLPRAIPPKPAHHDRRVLMNTAGLHHPHLQCQGEYWSCDITLWYHSVTSCNLELNTRWLAAVCIHVYLHLSVNVCLSQECPTAIYRYFA